MRPACRLHLPWPLGAKSRRGTSFIVIFILIPIMAVLYLLIMTRLEVAYRETKRQQGRAQARLLAESALAVLQATRASSNDPQGDDSSIERSIADSIGGSIEDVGSYRIAVGEEGAPEGRFLAVGQVGITPDGITRFNFIAEIEGEIISGGPEGWNLRLIGLSDRIEGPIL